jgi:hypothetical protein
MDIKTLSNRIQKLNLFSLLQNIFNKSEFKEFIIDKNQEQLYDSGIDAKGKKIRTYRAGKGFPYAPYTVAQKVIRNEKVNIVTLKDTGEFYESFKVISESEYVVINADFEKPDGNISKNLDITNVMGLTSENKELLIEKLKPVFIREFKEKLFSK